LNWQGVKNLTSVQIGAFLAILIVAVMPNFGLKYGASSALPAALLALLGGWLWWRQRAALFEAPAARRLSVVFALLLLPVLISIPASYQPRYSLGVAAAMAAYYLAGLALVRVLRGAAERERCAKWTLVMLAFWTGDSLIQYLFGVDLFGISVTPDQRVLGPFKDTLRGPTLIALLLPVALWVLLRRGVLPAILLFVAAGFAATLGGVRMVLVMLAVVAAGFYLRLPRWRFKIPAMLLALALVLAAVGLTTAMQQRMSMLGEIRDAKFETLDRLLSGRLTIWETASHMLLARPLTGVGAGAFAKAYDDHSTRPDDRFRGGVGEKVYHAHQVYFAVAAETGWPGLLGLLVAIGLAVKWYYAAPAARRDQAWPYALALAVYFFPLNTQPPIYHGNWLFPVLLLLLTALLAALDEERTPMGSGAPDRV
jgi:O-antigen ligase